jgi:hypothetical protein
LPVRNALHHSPPRIGVIGRLAGFFALLMLIAPAAARSQWIEAQPNFKALYAVVGRMHNIDADLLEAIAEVESGGDPQSVSPKGAVGLMQLMPSTASEFSVPDPFDPVSNVLGAADFIDSLRNRFATSLNLQGLPDLLAAYNAGPGAVEKYGGVPPYAETHKYVKRVIERYTNALSTRAAAPARLILRPAAYLVAPKPFPKPLMIADDGDGSVLNQLAALRRMRGHFAASIERGVDLSVRPVVRQKSAKLP